MGQRHKRSACLISCSMPCGKTLVTFEQCSARRSWQIWGNLWHIDIQYYGRLYYLLLHGLSCLPLGISRYLAGKMMEQDEVTRRHLPIVSPEFASSHNVMRGDAHPKLGQLDGWWLWFGELWGVLQGQEIIGNPWKSNDHHLGFQDTLQSKSKLLFAWFHVTFEGYQDLGSDESNRNGAIRKHALRSMRHRSPRPGPILRCFKSPCWNMESCSVPEDQLI